MCITPSIYLGFIRVVVVTIRPFKILRNHRCLEGFGKIILLFKPLSKILSTKDLIFNYNMLIDQLKLIYMENVRG